MSITEQPPRSDQSPLRAAVIETACNRWQTAEARWQECSSTVPALASLFLADISMRSGTIDRAMTNMALAEQLVPRSPYIQRLRDRAATVLQRRSANPDIANAAALTLEDLRKAARIAVECHRWPQAVELWSLFLEQSGSNPEAYRRLGTCYQHLGDYGNSVLYLREANKQSNDAQLAEAIDRSSRLDQRRFDSFQKHTQRFMQHPAFEVAQTAAVAGSARLGADLHTLSLVIKSPIAGSLAPTTTAIERQPPQPLRPIDAPAGVVLREIDLSAFQAKASPPPLPPHRATQAVTSNPTRPPVVPATFQAEVVTTPNQSKALHGVDALPLVRSLTRAAVPPTPNQPAPLPARPPLIDRAPMSPGSPTTKETGSLIQRLRVVGTN